MASPYHIFVQGFQTIARHKHIGVMFYVVIDPIGRKEGALNEIGLGGPGVGKRVVIRRGHTMLRDITKAQTGKEPSPERQKPKRQKKPRMANEDETTE